MCKNLRWKYKEIKCVWIDICFDWCDDSEIIFNFFLRDLKYKFINIFLFLRKKVNKIYNFNSRKRVFWEIKKREYIMIKYYASNFIENIVYVHLNEN